MTIEETVSSEERFWTEVIFASLKRFDVATAFLRGEASLELYRHLWMEQQDGLRVSMAASTAGHQVHWSARASASKNDRALRRSSAKEVWSCAFLHALSKGAPLLGASGQADDALQRYATMIGVDVSNLLADWNPHSRESWRRSWSLMEQES